MGAVLPNIRFDEMFRAGIRRDERVPRNSQVLTDSRNMKPTQFGLRAYEPPVQPISTAELATSGLTVGFPFPQLLRMKKQTLLAESGNTGIFAVTEQATDSGWLVADTKTATQQLAEKVPPDW